MRANKEKGSTGTIESQLKEEECNSILDTG